MTQNRISDYNLVKNDKVLEASLQFAIIIIGITGNSLNLLVLSRNKINITAMYLLAISAVDLLRLLAAIAHTLDFFTWMHLNYEYYWRLRPAIDCLSFAAQAMSLLLIVCFTINRYIVINDSFRKQILNTKKATYIIIFAVVVMCVLTRIPITLNIVSKEYVGYNEMTHQFCKLNSSNANYKSPMNNDNRLMSSAQANRTEPELLRVVDVKDIFGNNLTTNGVYNSSEAGNMTDFKIGGSSDCKRVVYYMAQLRAHNRPPPWYRLSIVILFALIPTITLIVFDIKLIVLLRRANLRRADLTNAVILKQQKSTLHRNTPLISKENRAILHLITIKAAIALFRLPYVIMMLFAPIIRQHDRHAFNIIVQLSLTLLDVNATANFFLFCLLPQHYRKQFVDTMSALCCKCRPQSQQQTQQKIAMHRAAQGHSNRAFISDRAINVQPTVVSNLPGNEGGEGGAYQATGQRSSISSTTSTLGSAQFSQTSQTNNV